ncbi:MAG: Cof-type HAD-IIB family hydrolase [Turicibacter sp.]|nr:Cof-type HAD-IIB family hydrolase [Turicibacter sp.]
MRRRLIALDMDGTLFSSDHVISAANKKAIKDAREAGHVVMLCSGRMPKDLLKLLADEGMDELPVSGGNGAVTLVDGIMINETLMKREVSRKLYDWLEANDYPFMICTDKGHYASDRLFERSKYEHEANPSAETPYESTVATKEEYRDRFNYTTIETFDDVPEGVGILKCYLMTPNMGKKEKAETFARNLSGLTVTSSFESNVEISDIDAHKGTGLSVVAAHYGIPMCDTVAIGDNFNDTGMFEAAGLSVAMGNAEEAIKEMCDVVTLKNDEDGVAHAINQYVLALTP